MDRHSPFDQEGFLFAPYTTSSDLRAAPLYCLWLPSFLLFCCCYVVNDSVAFCGNVDAAARAVAYGYTAITQDVGPFLRRLLPIFPLPCRSCSKFPAPGPLLSCGAHRRSVLSQMCRAGHPLSLGRWGTKAMKEGGEQSGSIERYASMSALRMCVCTSVQAANAKASVRMKHRHRRVKHC